MSSDKEKIENTRWICSYCNNSYSHTYRKKIHVDKCVVLNKKRDDEQAVLLLIKDELRNELLEKLEILFKELKQDITRNINTTNNASQSNRPRSVFFL